MMKNSAEKKTARLSDIVNENFKISSPRMFYRTKIGFTSYIVRDTDEGSFN